MLRRDFHQIIAVLACSLCFLLNGTLRAVQVYGTSGTGSAYATAPSDDFGFANVAQVWDSTDGFATSGVYLGNGWMLSAYHMVRNGSGGFLFGSVVLSGSTYSVSGTTAVRITDPVTNNPVDLAMYRLTTIPTDPNLKNLVVSGTMPARNSNLIMMGNGINRGAALTYWDANWAVVSGSDGYTYSGYPYGSGQSLRWGTGVVSGTLSGDDGYGTTSLFYTYFNQTNGSGMLAVGDSGGGVFYKSGTTWQLSGILLALGTYTGQPGNTSVVGDASYAANLAAYSNKINSTAFSPAITTLLGAQTVIAGQSVTFSITATGSGPYTYQWYKNGVAISGATGSSYTIPVTSTGDAADYTVKVTNPYGAITSSAYTLTVSTPVPVLPPWARVALPVLMMMLAAGDPFGYRGHKRVS